VAPSKRLRYEVLRRDNHTCRYCGRSAPEVEITVDHVIPVALGGRDEASNLVAACRDCNGGKTSLAPDAPLVADVAADALRWSQAITAAAGEMLARASGDVDACEYFDKIWCRYGTGPRRKPLPKDPGWQQTVRGLLSAGLPMTVLEECVEIAMGQRKVTEENVFRYMCGVAWKKVREIQDRAREIAQDGADIEGGEEADPDVEDAGVQNWCRIILQQRDPRDVEAATRECLERAGDDDPSGVLWFVIHDMETERASLREVLRDLMNALPAGTGEQLLREHEEWQREHRGDRADPSTALITATQWATSHMDFARARQEMAMMPASEYEAWIQRSMAENADIAEHLDRHFYVLDGARLAREALTTSDAHGEG
jgi:HNH endonuclease